MLSHWLSRKDWRVYCFFRSAVKSRDVVVLYNDGIPEAFDIIEILAGVVNFLPHASPSLSKERE